MTADERLDALEQKLAAVVKRLDDLREIATSSSRYILAGANGKARAMLHADEDGDPVLLLWDATGKRTAVGVIDAKGTLFWTTPDVPTP
jgi:hypothetical protein